VFSHYTVVLYRALSWVHAALLNNWNFKSKQKLVHSFDKILFSMKNQSRALRLIPVCKQGVKSLTATTTDRRHVGSLITVILQLKDAAGFVAALLHNASLSYQLGMIFKCKVSHLSFLGRFRRKETWGKIQQ